MELRYETRVHISKTLITIGIIGVVTAMTLPVVIAKYQKQVTINQLKAAYSIFTQALQQAENDYGKPIQLPQYILEKIVLTTEISELYFEPYLKGVTVYNPTSTTYVKTADKQENCLSYPHAGGYFGHPRCLPNIMCYWIYRHSAGYARIAIDLNGPKKPNIAGKDVFVFNLDGEDVPKVGTTTIVPPHIFTDNIDEFCSKTKPNISTNGSFEFNGYTCASKIIRDGWKISPDYPW